MSTVRAPFALGLVAATTLGVAGCYDPHPSPGAPCDETAQCPTEQTCVAGTCRLGSGTSIDAGTDGPASDQDRDGIADEVDNCPNIANTDQANEDGDKFGDACDPCPIVSADAPVDSDGDGVADACDPRPAMAGDKIVAFSGFPGGVVPTGWMTQGTVMPGPNGDVALVANSAVSSGALVYAPDLAFVNGSVTALVAMDSGVKVGSFTNAGMLVSLFNPDTTDSIQCGLLWEDVSKPTSKVLDLFDSVSSNGDLKTTPFAFELGTPYVITLTREGTNYTCSAATVGGSPITISASSNATPPGTIPSVLDFDGTGHVGSLLVVHSN